MRAVTPCSLTGCTRNFLPKDIQTCKHTCSLSPVMQMCVISNWDIKVIIAQAFIMSLLSTKGFSSSKVEGWFAGGKIPLCPPDLGNQGCFLVQQAQDMPTAKELMRFAQPEWPLGKCLQSSLSHWFCRKSWLLGTFTENLQEGFTQTSQLWNHHGTTQSMNTAGKGWERQT